MEHKTSAVNARLTPASFALSVAYGVVFAGYALLGLYVVGIFRP